VLKDADTAEEKALKYYRNGEYKLGLRFLYISLLIYFNEINVIRIDKSKTNRQYLKEVQRSGHARFDTFSEFTGVFNEVWYGNRKASGEMFMKWYENFNLLKKEATG
jgi:hypothetical protein